MAGTIRVTYQSILDGAVMVARFYCVGDSSSGAFPAVGTIPPTWVTATAYIVGDLIQYNSIYYRCIVAHTSGTWATDLTTLYWETYNVPILSNSINGGVLSRVVIVPGATNPTASWSFTLTDSQSIDLMGGTAISLSASASKDILPYYSSLAVYGEKPFTGPLTLTISGNSVASAIINIYAYIQVRKGA